MIDWNKHLAAAEQAWMETPMRAVNEDRYAPTRRAVAAFLTDLGGAPASGDDIAVRAAAVLILGAMPEK